MSAVINHGMNEYGALVEGYRQRKTEVLAEKSVFHVSHMYQPGIEHELSREQFGR
jgi:hypothetical protein